MMKKNYSFYSILTAIPLAAIAMFGFTSGQGGDFSGSPGDGGATCTNCHAPGVTHGGSVALTGIPSATGYLALSGAEQDLTLAITGSSVSKFGFNITAEDGSGNGVGTWATTANTQARNDGNGRTHTAAGTGSSSWALKWSPPTTDVGPITFYYSTIQANSASGNGGDQMISGNSGVLLSTPDEAFAQFDFYPNPVIDIVNIEIAANEGTLNLYDMNGRIVKSVTLTQFNEINLIDVQAGIYLMEVETVNGKIVKQLAKN